jgi:hypothetical protein
MGHKRNSYSGIDLRTALILLAALIVGIIAGLLTFQSTHDWAVSVLTAGGCTAGAAVFFDWLIT